jgi:hypothetical protein
VVDSNSVYPELVEGLPFLILLAHKKGQPFDKLRDADRDKQMNPMPSSQK